MECSQLRVSQEIALNVSLLVGCENPLWGRRCQERDYRLRIRIRGFEVTLRDEELYSAATGF